MKLEALKSFCLLNHVDIRFNEPMSQHTSLKIGGPSDAAVFPELRHLSDISALLMDARIPFVVIGRGTNILVLDGGIESVALFTERMDEISAFTDASQIQVQCGFPLQKLIKLSIEQGFSGMEGLVGIPGSLGGAIAGNAGSFGYEIKDAVASVSLLMTNGSIKTFPKYELSFGHRHFNIPNNAVITGAVLALRRDEPAVVQKRIKEFMLEKKARQPVAKFSAGCVFKNPSGVPAGRLIDEAGCKGMRCGGIEVSSLHANYFINSGSGTASDFLRLMEIVAEKVHALFGIMLEPEIKVIGRKG